MSIFPRLRLLDESKSDHTSHWELGAVALVCVQHLTESTGSLIEKFIEIGFVPNHIHVLGKIYSSKPSVQERLRSLGVNVYKNGNDFEWGQYSRQLAKDIGLMWQTTISSSSFKNVNRVIVLDDGGGNIAAVPIELLQSKIVIGVEQTMSGILMSRSERPSIPFIGIGATAAKLLIEPLIIRESVLRRAVEKIQPISGPAGVVGIGHIGRAVAEELQRNGVEVYTYDNCNLRQPVHGTKRCKSLKELYRAANTIWGCTGADHLSEFRWEEYFTRERVLISCSSKDSEFNSPLKVLNSKSQFKKICRLSDVTVALGTSVPVTILYGGFPINFSGPDEAESTTDIQLTRALLLNGVLQALDISRDTRPGSEVTLAARRQAQIVNDWFTLNPERRSMFPVTIIELVTNELSIERYQQRAT